MELTSEARPEAFVVKVVSERIDAAAAIQFKDSFRALTAGTAGRIVLDLANVAFLDSSGLGAVVGALKMLDDTQTLEIAALSPAVEKVFKLTRMDTVFTLHESLEAALAGPKVA